MKIPSNKQWTQNNSGDTLGILGDSVNMAFDTQGKAILARKAVSITGSRDDGDFVYPLAINYFDDSYVVLTSGEIFQGSAPSYTFTELTWPPAVGLFSDAVVFNNLYTITTTDKIYTWNGGAISGDWVDRSGSLTSGINHPMAVFGVLLAVGNGNTVKLLNTSYTLTQTLTLSTEHRVVTIRAVGDYIYVGTKNLNGGNAKIYVWDGNSTLFNYEVEVGASWVFSMTEYRNSVAAITSQGQLGIVNGTIFEEIDAFPVYHDPHARWQGSTGLLINGKVFNRGMCTIGNTIYINIEGECESGFIPEMKSGIWVYDPAIGLYHRSASSSDEMVRDIGLTRSSDILTTSAPHLLKTGDAVVFDNLSGLTGVSSEQIYYVTVVSSTEIKLSQSRKAVEAQNYVTLGGTPGASDALVYTNNTDYGLISATSGAIIPTTYLETPHSSLASEVIWGSRFDLPDGTAEYGLFSFADSYNVGSFTLQRIYSDNINQSWNELYNFIDGIVVTGEEVVVKIQSKYEAPSRKLTGTWLSTNTLNSQAEDYSAWMDIEEGYEIVVVDGYGRGRTAHVLKNNASSGTVSLVLDESIGTINETSDIYYTTFKKEGSTLTVDNKIKENLKSKIENLASPWVAIKIELRGFSPAVNMLDLSNAVQSNSN